MSPADSILITGGAGFIGTNLADALASDGRRVVLLDDLSRHGSKTNATWLQQRHPKLVKLVTDDVRSARLDPLVRASSTVFHLAAQVAVTTSLADPMPDFEVNAGGTLRLLEAARRANPPPTLVYTSTNKVYGALEDLDLELSNTGWRPAGGGAAGVSERRHLDLHSPYGCSKGSADQYVRDYARSFGLRTAVLRMSCIYGPHQNGTEDQGWVAHFARRALGGRPVTLYGDGHQVRDILHVRDLVRAFRLAEERAQPGDIYNIGGGPGNAVSILQVLREIEQLSGSELKVEHDTWRVGDQRWYVTDFAEFTAATGWLPEISWRDGLTELVAWLGEHELAAGAGGARVA